MSDDTRTRGNSWRLLIGAPLTFVVFFVGSMVLDWRTLPLGTNLGGSLLDATYYTRGLRSFGEVVLFFAFRWLALNPHFTHHRVNERLPFTILEVQPTPTEVVQQQNQG